MKLYNKAERALKEKYNIDLLEQIVLARNDRAVYYVEFMDGDIIFTKIHGKSPMDFYNDTDSFHFSAVDNMFDMNSKYGEAAGKTFYKNKNLNSIRNMENEANITIPVVIKNRRFWLRFHLYKTLSNEDGTFKLASCYITDVSKYLVHEEALYEKTHKDELTKLFNRYALYYHFELHGSRTPITSFYFDIDDFKQYNDTYGHDIGDEVLVQFASKLRALSSDVFNCYRLGGDEFYCLLYDTNPNEAEKIVDHLQDSMKTVIIPDVKEQLSISVGVLHSHDDVTYKRDVFMKEGDRLMYASKQNGKQQATYGAFLVYK